LAPLKISMGWPNAHGGKTGAQFFFASLAPRYRFPVPGRQRFCQLLGRNRLMVFIPPQIFRWTSHLAWFR